MQKPRIVVLGAGFGGLELSTQLSEALGDSIEVTLIDKNDAFVFGYSKLDVMFGHQSPEAVRLPYSAYARPGVAAVAAHASSPSIPRVAASPPTTASSMPIYLVVALGADYDFAATPGLPDTTKFYSVAGAERLRDILPDLHAWPGHHRRLRRALQMPAGAERVRPDAARLPRHARRPRKLRDHAGAAAEQPRAALARNLARAARGLRRAQHRLPARPARRVGRQCAKTRHAR